MCVYNTLIRYLINAHVVKYLGCREIAPSVCVCVRSSIFFDTQRKLRLPKKGARNGNNITKIPFGDAPIENRQNRFGKIIFKASSVYKSEFRSTIKGVRGVTQDAAFCVYFLHCSSPRPYMKFFFYGFIWSIARTILYILFSCYIMAVTIFWIK